LVVTVNLRIDSTEKNTGLYVGVMIWEHLNYVNVNLSWGSSRKLSEAGGETFAIFNAAWCESISAIQGMLPHDISCPYVVKSPM
jgi:hypothetical protein